jgi:hypothetical protein
MFDPRINNLSQYSDSEIENKISELGRKYWMSRNPEIQQQLAVALEMYKEEAITRRAKLSIQQQNNNNDDNSLDNLINVS